jgi:hypothetical protein
MDGILIMIDYFTDIQQAVTAINMSKASGYQIFVACQKLSAFSQTQTPATIEMMKKTSQNRFNCLFTIDTNSSDIFTHLLSSHYGTIGYSFWSTRSLQ